MDQFDKKVRKKLAQAPEHSADELLWKRIAAGISPKYTLLPGGWQQLAMIMGMVVVGLVSFWLGHRKGINQSTASLLENPDGLVVIAPQASDTVVMRDTIYEFVNLSPKPVFPKQLRSLGIRSPHSMIEGSFGIRRSVPSKTRGFLLERMTKNPNHANTPWHRPLFTLRTPYYATHSLLSPTHSTLKQGDTVGSENDQHLRSVVPILPTHDLIPSHTNMNILINSYYRGLQVGEIIKVNRARRWLQVLVPDAHRIGVVVGGLNPIGHDIEDHSEWIFGFQYQMMFSRSISVLSGFRHRSYRGKNEDDLDETSYPQPAGLQPSDRLHEVYIDKTYMSIPVVVKYTVPLHQRYRPYFMGGVLFSSNRSQDFTFEVNRPGGDEIKLRSSVGPSAWRRSAVIVGIGLEYNIGQRLITNIDIEGRYEDNSPAAEFERNHGVGLRVGLSYEF